MADYELRQSTAGQEVLLGTFVDSADGSTAKTALSIGNGDIKIFKAGATSEVSKNSGGATHIASGRYYTVLDATDSDTVGSGEINVHVTGALPVRRSFNVLTQAAYDAKYSNGVVNANVTQISGDATAADNLESQYDGTGLTGVNYPAKQSQATSIHNELTAYRVIGTVNDGAPTASGFSGDASLSSVDGFYGDSDGWQVLVFRSGSLQGQARPVTGYVGSTRTFSFTDPFPAAPANGDEFAIIGYR